jgi:hypothetical protein
MMDECAGNIPHKMSQYPKDKVKYRYYVKQVLHFKGLG